MNKKIYWTIWILSTLSGAVSALMLGIFILTGVLLFIGKIHLWETVFSWFVWAMFMTFNHFRKNLNIRLQNNGYLDEDVGRTSSYHLQQWIAIGLVICAMGFLMEIIRAFGDSVHNINSSINWKEIIFGVVAFCTGLAWLKHTQENLHPPIPLLTWPTGTEKIPIPGVPEKEKVPRRL